jgi:hypothetical protein
VTPSRANKPSLLSESASPAQRNNILADLQRRNGNANVGYHVKPAYRRLMRVAGLLAVIIMLSGVTIAAYRHRSVLATSATVGSPAPQIASVHRSLSEATPKPDVMPAVIDAPVNTATIVTASATELAADIRAAGPPLFSNASTSPGSVAIPQRTHIVSAHGAIEHASKSVPTPVVSTQANTQRRANTSSQTIMAAPASSTDSDVDLLAALIARARQRDPLTTSPVAEPAASTARPAASCTSPALDKYCSR